MIKPLIHDITTLSQKATPATVADRRLARDLLDTLIAHKDSCVGMAANMIGESKAIIVFLDDSSVIPTYRVMFNPVIIEKYGAYNARESCLSLLGGPRPCKRYKKIVVRFQNEEMETLTCEYTGFTAEIIQHEVEHLDGVLI